MRGLKLYGRYFFVRVEMVDLRLDIIWNQNKTDRL